MIEAMPRLSVPELASALDELDLDQIELARLVDTSGATVRRWLAGSAEVPGAVTLLVRLLMARPELKELIGARPRSGYGRPRKPRGKVRRSRT